MTLKMKRTTNKSEVITDVVPEPEVAPTSALNEGFVMVTPVYGTMTEPFQRILIPEGQATPVKMTSWVECQINAGLLKLE